MKKCVWWKIYYRSGAEYSPRSTRTSGAQDSDTGNGSCERFQYYQCLVWEVLVQEHSGASKIGLVQGVLVQTKSGARSSGAN